MSKEVVIVEPVNDIGLRIASECRLPEIKFYVESGRVLFWATTKDISSSKEVEAMQYLTPENAMKFAKAMEKCAIKALKESV